MDKKPLYRKINTQTHHVHQHGPTPGNFRERRRDVNAQEGGRGKMNAKTQRGLDYTPLYRFLVSKVGQPWDQVYGEAVGRLPPQGRDEVYLLVALEEEDRKDVVRTGESSFFSGLFVDEQGLLQVVDPSVTPASMEPTCGCCTHTLNGVVLSRKWPKGYVW